MPESQNISMFLTVPVCCFRKGFAREYLETEILPPPSTVYGFLLSLIGEEDSSQFLETYLAIAILRNPEISTILRTLWRVKNKKLTPGKGVNKRPDYQQILTNVQLLIFVKSGPLAQNLQQLRDSPQEIIRYGGVSLGESRDMVNDIIWFPDLNQNPVKWLTPDLEGDLSLPVWVDHVGSKDTVLKQFSLIEGPPEEPDETDEKWIRIEKNGK